MSLGQNIGRLLKKLKGKDPDFVSVVLLLRKPVALTQQILEQAVERAWPNEQGRFVVMSPLAILVKAQGHALQVVSQTRPYIEDAAEIAKQFEDRKTKEGIVLHKAWLAVDYLLGSRPKETRIDRQYAQAAKLACELVTEDCIGICLPGEELIRGSFPNLQESLRNFRSVKEFAKLSCDSLS